MNYGLYLSSSGMMTNMYRQNVLANNLANAKTVGFKADVPTIKQRQAESIEGDFGFDVRHDLLDRIGGGAFAGPQRIDLQPGSLEMTGNPLDVAIQQRDRFFAIGMSNGETGQIEAMLTRAGKFTRSADGQLVNDNGLPVLDVDGNPIDIPEGADVRIDERARVMAGNDVIAQLQIARVADTDQIGKYGKNLMRHLGDAVNMTVVDDPRVVPGHLEASGTDSIRSLVDLIETTQSIAAQGNLIRYQDQLMGQAVNTLGRVQA